MVYVAWNPSLDCYRSGLFGVLPNGEDIVSTKVFDRRSYVADSNNGSVRASTKLSRYSFLFRASLNPYEISLPKDPFRASSQHGR